MNESIWANQDLVKVLREGGVVVMPTDTIYGVVGRAENKDAVERIYETRKRAPTKPCIILIGDVDELKKFSINLSVEQGKVLEECWQNPVSVVLDCEDEQFAYLHRGTKTLAFRKPAILELQKLLLASGPLIAPSANVEGGESSKNITEAKAYFGDKVDLYLDGGPVTSKPSKVIRLYSDGAIAVLRE